VAASVLAGPTAAVVLVPSAATSAGAASSTACQAPAPTTAADSASTVGITAKTVTVGNVSIVSGPVPGLFEGAPIGVKAYFDYINSKGGVDGRTLSVDGYDDGFNAQANLSDTTTAVSKDFALVGDFSLFDSSGCPVLAQNPAVSNVSVTLDPGTNALPNTFSSQPLATGWNLGPLQYYKKHYPKDLTVGTLVSNVQSAITQWNGEKAALVHEGYKIGYERAIGPLESDFTTDIIHMKSLGVNVVDLTALDWQVAAIVIQDMTQQGWKPNLIMSGGPVYADQFIKTAGGAAATNGIWIGQEQALYLGQDTKTVPAVSQFLTWVKKANPSWTPDLYTLFGWTSAALFVQALQAAGPHPTRGAVLAQLKKVTSFDANGIIATDDPAKKLPPTCYLMARIVNGNFVRQSDPSGAFRCDGSFFYANASAG
jgi:ABC-type branched-subunit amino acid transport system substrate-binding protein